MCLAVVYTSFQYDKVAWYMHGSRIRLCRSEAIPIMIDHFLPDAERVCGGHKQRYCKLCMRRNLCKRAHNADCRESNKACNYEEDCRESKARPQKKRRRVRPEAVDARGPWRRSRAAMQLQPGSKQPQQAWPAEPRVCLTCRQVHLLQHFGHLRSNSLNVSVAL